MVELVVTCGMGGGGEGAVVEVVECELILDSKEGTVILILAELLEFPFK